MHLNPAHEKEVEKIAKQVLPGIPVSLSYDVVPEMQEYERTITTVANSYVRPKVAAYVKSLERKLKAKMKDVKLHILRSDGGMLVQTERRRERTRVVVWHSKEVSREQ